MQIEYLNFDDLTPDGKIEVFEQVRMNLLASGDIDPQGDEEDYDEYEERVYEATNDFLNIHNKLEVTI